MDNKGTVRRTTDGHLIHANIVTKLVINETSPTGLTKNPHMRSYTVPFTGLP